MTTATYPQLTEADCQALREFAENEGSNWKRILLNRWLLGSISGALYCLRNTHGPSWLASVDLEALEKRPLLGSELPEFDRACCGKHGAQRAPIISLGDKTPRDPDAKMSGLIPCDDWDAADWWIPYAHHDIACIVKITGRKPRYFPAYGTTWIRARITLPGDGDEPTKTLPGWVRLP